MTSPHAPAGTNPRDRITPRTHAAGGSPPFVGRRSTGGSVWLVSFAEIGKKFNSLVITEYATRCILALNRKVDSIRFRLTHSVA